MDIFSFALRYHPRFLVLKAIIKDFFYEFIYESCARKRFNLDAGTNRGYNFSRDKII
jgi:hypothetical protein